MSAAVPSSLRALWSASRRGLARTVGRLSPGLASAWSARRASRRRATELDSLARRYDEARARGGLPAAGAPWSVHHELTSRCNLACGMCYQSDWRAASPRLELD